MPSPPPLRRARFASLLPCGDDFVRIRHEVTGAAAYVPEAVARAWFGLSSERYVDAAERASLASREGLDAVAFDTALEALAAGGLVEREGAPLELGYDALADVYDARPPHPAVAFATLAAHTDATHWRDVLDVATGDGTLLPELTARCTGSLHAIDLSPRMVARARARVASLGSRATVQSARAEALPFVDESFDMVTCGAAHWWFDAAAFWSEARRVLRPGGVVALLSTVEGEGFFEALRAHEVEGRRAPMATDLGAMLGAMPAWVGLRHYERVPSRVTVASPAALAAWAHTFAPPSSDDAPWTGLEGYTGADRSWPMEVERVTVVALLEMMA